MVFFGCENYEGNGTILSIIHKWAKQSCNSEWFAIFSYWKWRNKKWYVSKDWQDVVVVTMDQFT